MADPAQFFSVRVDTLLFRVRWMLWVLVLPIAWFDTGGVIPTALWIWLGVFAVVNLGIGAVLYLAPRLIQPLPALTLAFDTLAFGILPYLIDSNYNLLAFMLIFPALVGAVRFGPQAGMIIAASLSLSIGAHALVPTTSTIPRDFVATLIPIAALFTATAMTGTLSQHEKEAALKGATLELVELRQAVAGAKLLYQTTDSMSLTTSYTPVLENMLEAGIKGLPAARRDDGSPVGIALFFDAQEPSPRLRVATARNLERRDELIHIPGKSGIVAETMKTGDAVIFDSIQNDPELGAFGALQRCRNGVCFPLRAGMEQYGVVVLASPAPRRPTPQYLELMRAFTSQAGIAFQNAKLYQTLRQDQDRIIHNENELRHKLARDLHDGPTQKVAGLVMQLDYIKRLMDHDPAEAKAEIEKARATAQQTVKEIRTALFTLRPLSLETQGLSAALVQFCERLRESENVPIQIESDTFGNDLDSNFATTVFAIVEEAIGNARKHANHTPIVLSLTRQDNSLIATIQDQGPGFNVAQVENAYDKRASLGLQNMRDRARLIDGNLNIDSAPGQGTRITLIAPVPTPSAEKKAGT